MIWIVLLLSLLLGGVVLGMKLKRWQKRQALAGHRARGEQGEKDAETWLKNHGFQIENSQVNTQFFYLIDGERRTFKVRPDIMATKQGERWLIEVKTGKSASPEYSATRRQIREYASLWPNQRYALFDATQGIFYEVSFEGVSANPPAEVAVETFTTARMITSSVLFLAGVILGWWLSRGAL
jgi:Holliday junction resolvase-like predicted endonuclease